MDKNLSTANLNTELYELSNALSGSEWNDEVKGSYYGFVQEEKALLAHMDWIANKANAIYNYVSEINTDRFKSTYQASVSEFQRIQRGD